MRNLVSQSLDFFCFLLKIGHKLTLCRLQLHLKIHNLFLQQLSVVSRLCQLIFQLLNSCFIFLKQSLCIIEFALKVALGSSPLGQLLLKSVDFLVANHNVLFLLSNGALSFLDSQFSRLDNLVQMSNLLVQTSTVVLQLTHLLVEVKRNSLNLSLCFGLFVCSCFCNRVCNFCLPFFYQCLLFCFCLLF